MPERPNRNRNQQKAKTDAQSTPGQLVSDSKAALVESVESQRADSNSRYQDEPPRNPFWKWLWKYSQSVLSILTILVLVVYVAIWYEARTTRELENRAYVAIRTVETVRIGTSEIGQVYVTVVNTGRTPGLNGDIRTKVELLANSPPEDTVLNPSNEPSSKILFAPQIDVVKGAGGVAMIPLPIPIQSPIPTANASPSANIKPSPTPIPIPTPTPITPVDANKKWYVYGVVIYEDTFGNQHHTKFCQYNIPGTTGAWWYCPTFNDAD